MIPVLVLLLGASLLPARAEVGLGLAEARGPEYRLEEKVAIEEEIRVLVSTINPRPTLYLITIEGQESLVNFVRDAESGELKIIVGFAPRVKQIALLHAYIQVYLLKKLVEREGANKTLLFFEFLGRGANGEIGADILHAELVRAELQYATGFLMNRMAPALLGAKDSETPEEQARQLRSLTRSLSHQARIDLRMARENLAHHLTCRTMLAPLKNPRAPVE